MVWLTANPMSLLFDRDEKTIRKHVNNVFSEGELEKDNNTQKMRVDGVKQKCLSIRGVIGTILGKNIKGADGHFPHEFIRRLLEEYASRELDKDIAALYEGLYGIFILTTNRTFF